MCVVVTTQRLHENQAHIYDSIIQSTARMKWDQYVSHVTISLGLVYDLFLDEDWWYKCACCQTNTEPHCGIDGCCIWGSDNDPHHGIKGVNVVQWLADTANNLRSRHQPERMHVVDLKKAYFIYILPRKAWCERLAKRVLYDCAANRQANNRARAE